MQGKRLNVWGKLALYFSRLRTSCPLGAGLDRLLMQGFTVSGIARLLGRRRTGFSDASVEWAVQWINWEGVAVSPAVLPSPEPL